MLWENFLFTNLGWENTLGIKKAKSRLLPTWAKQIAYKYLHIHLPCTVELFLQTKANGLLNCQRFPIIKQL